MVCIDMFADVIPGKSAAGFTLGMSISLLQAIKAEASLWDSKSLQIQEAVLKEKGWLLAPDPHYDEKTLSQGCTFYYNQGAVKIHFDSNSILDLIEVSPRYSGLLFNKIKTGDLLNTVHPLFAVEFDETEELYLPIPSADIHGLLIRSDGPDQRIDGLIVVPIELP